MNADEWIATFSQAVGRVPPEASDISILLQLAGIAAHESERTAAPITCWLAAQAGLSPTEALAIATALTQPGPQIDDY